MTTKIIPVYSHHPQQTHIKHAAEILHEGGIVAFPTETVYGLGARLSDEKAIKKIFIAKKRPADNPLIAHVASFQQAHDIAYIAVRAKKLMDTFWPGPLTLVLKKKQSVPDIATAGLSTVCVRMPHHPVALALIKAVGEPVVAPSANSSGRPSPTTAAHVEHDLHGRIPLILDGGTTKIGLESTVLNLTTKPPIILRPGVVTFEQLKKYIPNLNPSSSSPFYKGRKQEGFISPGMKYRHYAPKAKLILVIASEAKSPYERSRETRQSQGPRRLPRPLRGLAMTDKKIAILDLRQEKNLGSVAKNLFAQLRAFDQQGVTTIVVYGVPEHGLGMAIMNRLRKAASRIISLLFYT